VGRLYLEDLVSREDLSPNLSLLKLVVVPDGEASALARSILNRAQTPEEFEKYLDVVEAILVNKFTTLSIEEIRNMLDLKTADVTQTRFYQEVREIGRQEGEQLGRANLILRLLDRRFGEITPDRINTVRGLSIPQLESLGVALLDFQGIEDLDAWLQAHRG
jgi:predicted transposase YdaD